jgi:ABC-type amino acid transport substrate-binding protein
MQWGVDMKNLVFAALLGGLIVLAGVKIFGPAPETKSAAQPQSAFDRVIATHTLRCAYASYDPFLIVGADKKITGIFHDAIEEAAKRLGLKVEWAEEVGYGNINTGFATGRYDAFCAGLWPAGTRAANTIFSRPVVWDPVGVWARVGDTRFEGHMDALNDPAHKISMIEGDATEAMADALFPKAGRTAMSQNQSLGEEISQVTSSKADAVFLDYLTADKFMQNTPGSLKNLSPDRPALIYALTVGFGAHEAELKNMLDVVLNDMDRDGTTGRIVKTYLGDKSNLLFYQQNQFLPY